MHDASETLMRRMSTRLETLPEQTGVRRSKTYGVLLFLTGRVHYSRRKRKEPVGALKQFITACGS